MGKRRRDPTVKRPQEGEEKEDALLEEKYKKLEEHWNTCKKSNPSHKVLRRCSTGSSTSSSINSVDYQLFNKYSPRELMSSLQAKHRRSVPPPSEGEGISSRGSYMNMMMMFNSKVSEENDDMLVELLRDRLSAIQSGKLKGRRLFQDSTDLDGEEICSDCFDLSISTQQISEQVKSVVSSYASADHEIINDGCTSGGISKEDDDDDDELCSPSSSASSSSSLIISNEKLVEREKVVVLAMERENNVISTVAGDLKINIGKGERVKNNMPAAMAWLGIVLMLFVMIWMSCNAWYVGTEDDVEVFLVPT